MKMELRCVYAVAFLFVGVIGDHMDQYFQNCKVDVGFVLDGSGSVGTTDWQVTLDYVKEFADSVSFSQEFTQIGVVTFGNDASLDIKLGDHGDDCDAFQASVGTLGYRDENTNTAAGIRVAREQLFDVNNGDRADAPNVMIIITDGYPTRETDQTLPQSYQAVDEGTTIFTIGIGSQIDMQQLFMIASNTTGHSWTVGDYGHLSDEIYAVLGATCTIAITPDIVPDPDPCHVGPSCYDVAFVLDGSGSVGQTNWNSVLQFLLEYSQMILDGSNRIGVVTFGNEASIEIDFNVGSTVSSIQGALDGIVYRDQNTNTASGLRMACTELYTTALGARAECQDRLVLITDGLPTMEVSQTYIEAANCRDNGIMIYSLGVGEQINYETLYMLANNASSRVRQIDEFQPEQLAFGTEQLAITSGCECPIFDLILVLDGSGSMGENNWILMKQFAIELVSSMDVGPAKTRVAVVTYSTEAGVEFLLNAYNTTAQYEAAILAITMHGQRTNIADGLKMVTQYVLGEANGDRPDVENLVIVVSDGRANQQEDEILSSAAAIQEAGTPIMAIGVGMDADMVQMRKVASQPCYNFLRFYDDMPSLVLDVDYIYGDVCDMMGHLDEYLQEPTIEIHEYAHNGNTLILLATDGNSDDWNVLTEYVANQFDEYMEDITSYNIGVYTANAEIALGSNVVSMPNAIRSFSNPGATPIDVISLTYIQNLISTVDPLSYNVVILTNSLTEEQADALQAGEALLRNSGVSVVVLAGGYREASLFGNWYMDGVATIVMDEMSHFQYSPTSLFDIVAFLSVPVVGWCDFEDYTHTTGEICGTQIQNDDFDWTVNSGSTPSRHTGPEAAQQGQFYIFIEASSPRVAGDHAALMLPFTVESSTASAVCITFYYHMRGFHTGTLQVVHVHSDGHKRILWQMSGPQGDDWQMGTTTLNMSQGDTVGFRAIRAGAFSGDIAVDAVAFHASMCPSNMPYS